VKAPLKTLMPSGFLHHPAESSPNNRSSTRKLRSRCCHQIVSKPYRPCRIQMKASSSQGGEAVTSMMWKGTLPPPRLQPNMKTPCLTISSRRSSRSIETSYRRETLSGSRTSEGYPASLISPNTSLKLTQGPVRGSRWTQPLIQTI
jgi:hypothetical protein